MQVLCVATTEYSGVWCKICGQFYKLYFERQSPEEREEATEKVTQVLLNHHVLGDGKGVHPQKPFTVPEWPGATEWSAAALLGGAPAHS